MVLLRNLLIATAVIAGCPISAAAQPAYLNPMNPDTTADVNRLLGGGFSNSDRVSVQRCAIAAIQMAAVQYWPRPDSTFSRPDLQRFPDGQGINPAARMRVIGISNVQHRKGGVQVSGIIDGRAGYPLYGPVYGEAVGDLNFVCYVDTSGITSNVRVTERR